MTVSTTLTKVSYSGNGSDTVFAYTYKVFDEDDLTVILRDNTTGTETVQAITTNYTVSGVGDAGGGNVTFVTAPATGKTIVLKRESAATQTTDYTPNDPFPAEEHERALDKLTFLAQERQEELDRTIKLSRTNTMTSTEFTVGATERANKILGFDGSGELNVTQELGTFKGNWSSGTSFAVRDLVKDTSNNNIYICQTAHTSSGSQPISTNTDSGSWELIVDAASATTSATNAAASATAAASSATDAETAETNAETAETNAETAKTAAETAKTAAETAKTAAETAQTAAETAETNAETAETNASTSETNALASKNAAATSATNAATSATTATTQATAASTSATNAAASATTATTQASAASTSATNAATSATSASTAQTAAETAKTAAEAAQTAAELAADNFDDTYLGAKASDPTVDNDGDALTAGDLYFNTTSNELKYYNGTSWSAISPGITDIVSDTTPQLGGNLDVQTHSIVSTSNQDINITPNGTGNVLLGNYEFDADQTVGSGQDDYVMTYDNSTGHISLEAAAAAGATGGGSDEIFYENGQSVTTNYTISDGKNAMSAGPITINTGVTVTVGTGETWTVV